MKPLSRCDRRTAMNSILTTGALGRGGIVASPAALASSPAVAEPGTTSRVLNVRALGAKGDGKADDTAAIVACIAACGEAGGGMINSPPGTYILTSTIQVNHSSITLQGAGWGNTLFAPEYPQRMF